MVLAALVLVGAGAGVGMAVTADNSTPAPASGSAATAPTAAPGTAATAAPGTAATAAPGKAAMAAPGKAAGKAAAKKHAGTQPGGAKVGPARQVWAHKCGVDRATMANLAPAASASADQQAAAKDLAVRTEAATAPYADLTKAKAAGFVVEASLARNEKERPNEAAKLADIDSGQKTPNGMMPMLHVGNKANHADGKILDPSAPETLMYSYAGQGRWTLVGVMYTANESYPQAPPDPGGPITRWHYHEKSGGQNLMMHIFFVPGNDLAHAYAADMNN